MRIMTTYFQSPQTPAEWQAAVDLAYACLLLDRARQFGLVTALPRVNVPRCEEVLALGRARGFEPANEAVDRLLAEVKNRPKDEA